MNLVMMGTCFVELKRRMGGRSLVNSIIFSIYRESIGIWRNIRKRYRLRCWSST